MAQYINTKTGVVIDVNSVISGGSWKAVSPSAPAEKKQNVQKTPVKKESKK